MNLLLQWGLLNNVNQFEGIKDNDTELWIWFLTSNLDIGLFPSGTHSQSKDELLPCPLKVTWVKNI